MREIFDGRFIDQVLALELRFEPELALGFMYSIKDLL